MKHSWNNNCHILFVLIFFPLIFGFGVFGFKIQFSSAAEKEIIPQMEVKDDFVMSGGKIEVEISPGEEISNEISITSRLGREMKFNVDVEDFVGSNSQDKPAAVLLGDQKSPYSLKEYIRPELMEFNLVHGERIRIPFTIKIPADAEPGGLYGSIVIWASNPDQEGNDLKDVSEGQVKVVSRLASLIFVRVKGNVTEDGLLVGFKTLNNFYEKGPVKFEINYENNGNIHVNPYGIIEVTNMLGRKVGAIEIDPFYSLPKSKRWQYYSWNRKPLIGFYTAKLSLNRGYKNIIDEKNIRFWIIPWKILMIGFLISAIIVWLLIRLFSRYEVKKKI